MGKESSSVIGIYGIFCAETKECLYVGQSRDVAQRFRQHLKLIRSGKHRRKELIERWTFNGSRADSLFFKILEECSVDKLNEQEVHWFNELSPLFYGHKPTLNGKWEKSENTRRKISDSQNKRHEENGTARSRSLNCGSCGMLFETKRKTQRFCSLVCFGKSRSEHYGCSLNDLSKEELEDLYYRQELSSVEIGKLFDAPHQTVQNILKRNGVKLRGRRNSPTNAKISKTMRKTSSHLREKRICLDSLCNNSFETTKKRDKKFCSRRCADHNRTNQYS